MFQVLARLRVSNKTGVETLAREEWRKRCIVLTINVFAEAKDLAGESGYYIYYYKDQCFLQKLASARKHYAMQTVKTYRKGRLSIKLSNFSTKTGQGTPVHRGVG